MTEAWREMAGWFRAAAARWPELRHVLIENTEAVPIDPAEFGRVSRLVHEDRQYETLAPADRALWDRYREQAAPFCGPEMARLRSELAPVVRSVHDHLRGVEHYFHGDREGSKAPSWHEFADLAHLAVKLAADAGSIDRLPPHDPARYESQALQGGADWMELIYRLARARRPGALLSVRDRGESCGTALPEGLRATTLPYDVFTASALASDALAAAPVPPNPALPATLDSRAVGIAHEMIAGGQPINVAEVARRLEVDRTKLYRRCPGFRALVEQDRAGAATRRDRMPRGWKDRGSRALEARAPEDDD